MKQILPTTLDTGGLVTERLVGDFGETLQYVRCHLCGQDRTRLLFRRRDARLLVSAQSFDVVQCRSCSVVYVNPRPTETEIQRYYTSEFYEADLSPEQALESNRPRLEAMYRCVQHLSSGRLLDIGCYKGEFLRVMQIHGWQVHGVEFHPRPPNLFELDIHYGSLDTACFQPHSFDLVTMWAVLEHVYEPKKMLQNIHKLLRPAGRLIILVPNFNSIPARFMRHDDVPRHVTMFSKRTLSEMLAITGYQPRSFWCSQDVYSGSVRGFLNFLVKRLAGETMDQILFQNRRAERWHEFSRQIHGKDSRLMERIDLWDQAISPKLDRLMDYLGLGFIMTVEASPEGGANASAYRPLS
jgi:2-polyprenyl-3-methyl-5-hydroxy-6-metoxy-1,4-benzoquinol methylase